MVQKSQNITAIAVRSLFDEYKRLNDVEDDVKAQKAHIRMLLRDYAIEYDKTNTIEKGKFVFDMAGEKDLSVSWKKEKGFRKELFLIEHSMEEYEKYSDVNDNVTIRLKQVKHEPEYTL